MNGEQQISFLQMQNCVLTEDSAAMKCENGGHAHFVHEDQIPFRKLRHKHVVQIVGSYTEPQSVTMIMSPVAECDLLKFMENGPTTEGFLPVLRTFPGCLATALEYLHHEGIRHKDIKPSNILVNGCNILFTDFGISRDCDGTRDATSGNPGAFTRQYSAPEVAEQN
ncbi:kinase-like domain-containing protein, partial [Phaeosphaeriaceae sp. PMI808]